MSDLNFIIVAREFNVFCRSEVKMVQNTGDFTAKVWRAVMKYVFLKGNSIKKNYDDMSVTLGDKRPSYSTVENWVARNRTRHLSTEDEERSGRPTQATIPVNVDAIYSMILDDRRLSAKKLAETLAISLESIGYIVHEILDISSQPNWSPKVSMLIRSVIECLLHEPFWTDFGGIQWNFLTSRKYG
jgi:transposase